MTAMTAQRAGEARPFSYSPTADKQAKPLAPAPEPVTAIRVSAEADSNILARIVQPMVKLDLVPRGMYVLSDHSGEMEAKLVFAAADADQVRRLENSLRAVIGVTSVELI
jgi:(p)ppGpp synthase/HD superfamily hydrolase